MKIMYLHFSQRQIARNYIILTLITLLSYFAISRNANLFVHERLTNLQLFVETSPNKLSSLPKKDNK